MLRPQSEMKCSILLTLKTAHGLVPAPSARMLPKAMARAGWVLDGEEFVNAFAKDVHRFLAPLCKPRKNREDAERVA
jgi:hypothetical protein